MLTRIGAWSLIVLGALHLVLLTILHADVIGGWFAGGLWAAVPLGGPAAQSAEVQESLLAFWAGYGSFGMPFILLGALLLRIARRTTPPVAIGVVVALWGAIGAVLLVPSPMVLAAAAGVVLIIASVRGHDADRRR